MWNPKDIVGYDSGDTVIYTGCTQDQINWGNNQDPRNILVSGSAYIVEKVEVHSWHTKVWIKDHGGPYGSVSFKLASDY